jgi:hypothetical protein
VSINTQRIQEHNITHLTAVEFAKSGILKVSATRGMVPLNVSIERTAGMVI